MDFFSKENVIFSEGAVSKEEVIRKIAERAEELNITNSQDELVKSFMYRESIGPTGLGDSLAIPHAKSDSVIKPSVIVLKSSRTVEWESIDGSGAKLIIALMIPESGADNSHLKILSSVSRKLVNEEFKNSLFNAKTAEEIESLFMEIEI